MCVFCKNEGINREREDEGRKEEKVREKKRKRKEQENIWGVLSFKFPLKEIDDLLSLNE